MRTRVIPEWAMTVRLILVEKKIRQKELARRMDVTATYVSDILNGNRTPNPRLCDQIADALNLSGANRKNLHWLGARQVGYDV